MSVGGRPSAGRSRAFELRLLGPVEAVREGCEVALGGPKQRAVLALLLLEAGRVVPAGRLVEAVWRGSPPPRAAKTLQSYVSRLRTALEPDVALVARAGGYVISAEPGLVDTSRFEALVAAGRAALGQGEAARAGHFMRQAGSPPPAEIAKPVLGAVAEVPMHGSHDILAAYKDGTANYLNYSGRASLTGPLVQD